MTLSLKGHIPEGILKPFL